VTGSSLVEIKNFKSQMQSEFEMTDLGKLTYFLGMELLETSGGIVLHQAKYAKEILRKFEMVDCNSSVTPADTKVTTTILTYYSTNLIALFNKMLLKMLHIDL
jgi:hypothetical protein